MHVFSLMVFFLMVNLDHLRLPRHPCTHRAFHRHRRQVLRTGFRLLCRRPTLEYLHKSEPRTLPSLDYPEDHFSRGTSLPCLGSGTGIVLSFPQVRFSMSDCCRRRWRLPGELMLFPRHSMICSSQFPLCRGSGCPRKLAGSATSRRCHMQLNTKDAVPHPLNSSVECKIAPIIENQL